MNDIIYYQQIANLLASLTLPAKDVAALRAVADLVEETDRRGLVASQGAKVAQE